MQTWESIEEMKRGMSLMLQGNPYFAWQYIKKGTLRDEAPYRPCKDLRQLENFQEEIFKGTKTVGFYSIQPDNQTIWGASDFDNHSGSKDWRDQAECCYTEALKRFDETWLLSTHPGGFHVISFVSAPIQAREMRRALNDITPSDVEVFPKQDALGEKPNAKGSLLRFPGRHQLKRTWTTFVAKSGRVESPIALPKWESPSTQGKLSSLYFIATKGVNTIQEGQRFNCMKRIAGRLKGRVESRDEARQIYTIWHNKNASKITTPFNQSLKAFMCWFDTAEPCNVKIPDYQTTSEEEARISSLGRLRNIDSERLKEVARLFFRIKNHAKTKGVTPFLSCRMISEELGMSIATASRYRSACVQLGLVELVSMGHTGEASTYLIK
jgi:hypothetical protein